MKTYKSSLLFTALFLLLSILSCKQAEYIPASQLILIKDYMPGIDIDLKYADTLNFTKTQLYPTDSCWLAKGAVEKLKLVEDSLNRIRRYNGKEYPAGLGLRIWDAFRPISVQYKMWEIVPDARYVADPKKGSSHNRGGAVDVTLIDRSSGEELAMPTDFDYFGEEAHHDFKGHPTDVLQNRTLLKEIMVNIGGFAFYKEEWWHYKFPPSDAYPLRDWEDKDH